MLLTDQYSGINSREFKELLKKENIQMVFTAVDAPFSNGLNERLNQTLVNKIRCKIEEKKNLPGQLLHNNVQNPIIIQNTRLQNLLQNIY